MPHCFAAFISIGSIMPHALASGKPRRCRHRLVAFPLRGEGRVGVARRKTFAESDDAKAFSAKRNDGLREA
jgi:hypothetical protein